ncbi:hypothetical protein [Phenylobacterium sp.]|uniref:hypothetical protein n=1 Tax=Phenylobacterium sp. TaxID=1871053 RepID=UPI002F3F1936
MTRRRLIRWLQILREVLLIAAVLAGGAWAYFKYFSAESPQAQLENSERQKRCLARGSLDIGLSAHDTADAIIGSVTAKNVGDREVLLKMGQKPVLLSKYLPSPGGFTFDQSRSVGFPRPEGAGRLEYIDTFSILPGRTVALNFVSPNLGRGVYVITFEGGSRATATVEPDCPAHGDAKDQMGWFASTIIEVPSRQP